MDEKEIKILLGIKDSLKKIMEDKNSQIQVLEKEIQSTSKQCDLIDMLISKGSFTNAVNLIDAESAAHEKNNALTNMKYSEQIFSKKRDLLAVLQFQEDSVFIRFPTPILSQITQEKYINEFVKPRLVSLKKIETNIIPSLTKNEYEGKEYIDSIILQNISNFESFEYLVESIQMILGQEI